MQFRPLVSLFALLAFSAAVSAQNYQAGTLHVDHPYARATVPGQPSGAAYMTLENRGKDGDRLLAAASPVAQKTEIHTMSMDGNVMKMRQVAGIDLAPASKVVMKPGDGYHIMLLGLKQQLKAGDTLPLTLTFEKAGKLEVSVPVQEVKRAPMMHGSQQH
ncbi:MAG TPA: copper chaperone PCu(A)C [Burkholderiaceae bacterium]|nr:copper chaperone PCu(A)C [Burkholderiaceae bacterium]